MDDYLRDVKSSIGLLLDYLPFTQLDVERAVHLTREVNELRESKTEIRVNLLCLLVVLQAHEHSIHFECYHKIHWSKQNKQHQHHPSSHKQHQQT